ncbi:MAG: hypothetical protein EOM20_20565, partial [Spartobacteria bacterium]|nr:hypothetical protein [Spartobacteria bacterium]
MKRDSLASMHSTLFHIGLITVLLALFTGFALGQVNLHSNGSFEYGVTDMGWGTNIVDWTSYDEWGGSLVTSASAYDGSRIVRMNANGDWTPLIYQNWPASEGVIFEVNGQLRSPLGGNYFSPVNGFVMLVIKFFNSVDVQIGQDILSPKF